MTRPPPPPPPQTAAPPRSPRLGEVQRGTQSGQLETPPYERRVDPGHAGIICPPSSLRPAILGGPRRSGEGDALPPDELVAQSPTGAAQQRARRAVRSPHAGADLGAARTGCGEEKGPPAGVVKAR